MSETHTGAPNMLTVRKDFQAEAFAELLAAAEALIAEWDAPIEPGEDAFTDLIVKMFPGAKTEPDAMPRLRAALAGARSKDKEGR